MLIHPRAITIHRWWEGELEPGKRRRVTNHLAACPRCQKTIGFYIWLRQEGQQLKQPKVSPKVMARIKSRIMTHLK